MRPIYLFLKFLLKITLWVYYPRFILINTSNKRLERTIYMSNHASSFMDPLTVGGMQHPIVFFMTRADIYNGVMKFIFWLAHMLPIYRKQDGVDTKLKNDEVFHKCNRLLRYGRNLLVFSEGFTDDVFIRRLKPLKKGAVRIGFSALEECNWKYNIYLRAVGANYSDPSVLGSDCIISNGDPVCLNGYKAQYEENPHKTVSELTKKMEEEMRNQITDVRSIEMASFHENVMRLTRKGMNEVDSDKSILLLDRWKYSKELADWFNNTEVKENMELLKLKKQIEDYFDHLKKNEIEETPLFKVLFNQRKQGMDLLYLIALAPFMVIGQIFTYIPYIGIKNFVEKSFKRRVFWSSVKMLVGFAAVGIYNFILLFVISKIIGISFLLLLFLGIFTVPVLFVIVRNWTKTLNLHRKMKKIAAMDISAIAEEREGLMKEIQRLIPVA